MRLTLFDLDHTLLDGDSNRLWLGYLVERGLLGPEVLERQEAHYARYLAGTLDIDDYLAFHLSLIEPRPVADWLPVRAAFVASRVAPRIGPAARATVARHVGAGDRIAVVTATHEFLARGIVDAIGPLPLVATACEVRDGRFTGRTAGPACFASAKPRLVRDWLAESGRAWSDFEAVRFYSDSSNDLPLLEAVSEPVVVDPDERLAALAAARGWPRLSWARPPAG